MNILILSWRGTGHPHAGGAEISTHEHAKGWVKYGHNVTLFTSAYPGCKKEEEIDGVKIKRSGSQILGVHIQAFKWYMRGDHERFDLVIDQFHGLPFFTPLYVRVKKLAFIHEVTKEVWRLNQLSFPFNLFVAVLGTLLEPLLFKLYKNIYFMTVSESTKKDLIAWGIPNNNIKVIYNGLNISKVRSYHQEKKKTLIFLGALSKDKGIERVLKIFSMVSSLDDNFQFWIVGKGEATFLKKLELQCKELGIEKKIKFWGFVNEEMKYKLLSRSHVLVNTSIREGWGLVIIEAASMGIPSVAFDVPGLRDSIISGKTGIIDKQHSLKSFTFHVINLLNNNKRYQKMREEAVKWSKRFTWEKSINKSLDLIDEVMRKK